MSQDLHLYIHIPFCKKACHYCSFYFLTTDKHKEEFVQALIKEIRLNAPNHKNDLVKSIYFGGGTPTLLESNQLQRIIESIYAHYQVAANSENSIESNPENLSEPYVNSLRQLGFNRLSIGVQSFDPVDLETMNRSHTAEMAHLAIENATQFFDNVSLDFIFGLPYSSIESWKKNLEIAVSYPIQHISTYNLTVEEKTALHKKVKRSEIQVLPDEHLNQMYDFTLEFLAQHGLENYEISNFAKLGYESIHNQAYWNQKTYLGFGPSAHSYDGVNRYHNPNHLKKYIESIDKSMDFKVLEKLSTSDRYNEFVLTRLRIREGIKLNDINKLFGLNFVKHFSDSILPFELENHVRNEKNTYQLTQSGKKIADYISMSLMNIDSK